ncbi:MAG: hypothetical protein HFG48_02735 [Bacilli bacterium]|nr:hypothetical protein [Bacilli bacterium]
MTLSLLNLKYFITKDNIANLKFEELGFILTVLRDNCLNDEVYKFLDNIIKELKIRTK